MARTLVLPVFAPLLLAGSLSVVPPAYLLQSDPKMATATLDINDATSAVKVHVIHLLQQNQLSACWSILEKTLPSELFTRLKISPIPRGLRPKKRIRSSTGKSPKVAAPVSPQLEVDTGLLPPAERKQ